MALKIYTKTGDSGQTALFGGRRVDKHNTRIEAYGTVDELNASIGYLCELINDARSESLLIIIQSKLFNVGSQLAADPHKEFKMPEISEDDIRVLEEEIDRMVQLLPKLTAFILPSGHPNGAYAHVVRTICRRTERRVVALATVEKVNPLIVMYLNRLSDYFFTLARYLVYNNGGVERTWDPEV